MFTFSDQYRELNLLAKHRITTEKEDLLKINIILFDLNGHRIGKILRASLNNLLKE